MKTLILNVVLRPNSIGRYFSIGIGYIATALKKAGFEFDIYDNELYRNDDETVHEFLKENIYNVYMMGTLITGFKRVRQYAAWIREINPNAVIIAGNSVASSIPEILLRNTEVDIASLGEGDITSVELLTRLQNGEPWQDVQGIAYLSQSGEFVQTPSRRPIEDLDALGFIDYSLFDFNSYIEIAATEFQEPLPVPKAVFRPLDFSTGRGCVANCTFCYHAFKNLKYRKYSIPVLMDFLEEMIEKYRITYINFCDDLTFYSKQQVVEFCNAILERGMKIAWCATCRANLLQEDEDVEIARLMKKSGCWQVGFSLENADPNILKMMKKHISVEQFQKQTRILQAGGITVVTSIILGYPIETRESIVATFKACADVGVYPSPGFLQPYPGSEMYQYAVQTGHIADELEYIESLGERKQLNVNLTSMTQEEILCAAMEGLELCSRVSGIPLSKNSSYARMARQLKEINGEE